MMMAFSPAVHAQQADWQQRVAYDMDIHLDVDTNIMRGQQRVRYHNASPDTLTRFYYHLYYNAFQPGSMMDVRSRSLVDPDRRVRDRILQLTQEEIGYQNVESLTQNGIPVSYEVQETVLIVELARPIPPGEEVMFEMEFQAQVPLQIRRTGRDNHEDIRYSMSQWYPKVAEYDQDGWHTDPYVAREFHAVFGDFDVRITIDKDYTLGATGYLQNPQEVGHGYENPDEPLNLPEGDELTWHFYAPDVIDFFWGADDKFTHVIHEPDNGPRLHFLYVERPETQFWELLPELTAEAFSFMNEYIGEYPYEQFTVIQGGDGGMEYPMGTLITGHRGLFSLVGVTVHELVHMWFHTRVATNESLHHWMDEGFTVYMSELTMHHLFELQGRKHESSYMSYLRLVYDGLEEPMGQQADRFRTNAAYVMASYRKGALFLHQLEYIIGEDALKRTLRRYFAEWSGKHATPTDFQRIAEQESGLQLKWYFDEMLYSTRTADMAIGRVASNDSIIEIDLQKKGGLHMPVDLLLRYEDGHTEMLHIPTQRQLGAKPEEDGRYDSRRVLDSWAWTHRTYSITIPAREAELSSAELDPSLRLADTDRLDNRWPAPLGLTHFDVPEPEWETYQAGVRPALWYGENAGIRAGYQFRGSYLFDTRKLDVELWFNTGNLENFDSENMSTDYRLAWEDRFRALGPEGYWHFNLQRRYGITQQEIGLSKELGAFGRLDPGRQEVGLRLFHLNQGLEQQITPLQQRWEEGSLWGAELRLELGEPYEHNMALRLQTATFGNRRAAHQFGVDAWLNWHSRDYRFRTRLGMSIAGGPITQARQQRFNLGYGTGIDAWENRSFTALANIDGQFYDDARFALD
ncbi:MAG: M1 family metallopeptidase, partial [Cyclonatronaceae bacterium]